MGTCNELCLKEVIECDGFLEALVWGLTLPFLAISCSSFYTFCTRRSQILSLF